MIPTPFLLTLLFSTSLTAATLPPGEAPKPALPLRRFVGVQGVVYCKSCKYIGVDTLLGASPLEGAVVKMECNNTRKALVEAAKTDKNGYFFFNPKALTTDGAHKCKVFLESSNHTSCSFPSNINGGVSGAALLPSESGKERAAQLPFALFAVGPFAFEPKKDQPCK